MSDILIFIKNIYKLHLILSFTTINITMCRQNYQKIYSNKY